MKDFFISYNSDDKQWAEWIAFKLEEVGCSTVIQAWDFRPGGDFVMEMQNAATGTKKTIAVLSDHYLNAEYTQPEWGNAFARDPKGVDRTLIPVRVAKCKPTGLLTTRIYCDLVGLSEDDARDKLIDAVDENRAKPESSPPFPAPRSGPQKPALSEKTSKTSFPGQASAAVDVWLEKLEFLRIQEALNSDPGQKWSLENLVKEAENKIRELGGDIPKSAPDTVPLPNPNLGSGKTGQLPTANADAPMLDPAEVSDTNRLARAQLAPFAAKVLKSKPTRNFILGHNKLKSELTADETAEYILKSECPMDVLFKCVQHDLEEDAAEEVAKGIWTLVETVTPVSLVVISSCEKELVEHLNNRLSHVGINTRYVEVGKSLVGTIKGLPVDLRHPDEFNEMSHTDLHEGRDRVISIPAPPELGAFPGTHARDENTETIVSVFEAGLKRYLQPRTTVRSALKARAARGIITCVLMTESPGVENLKDLHAAFPELVLFVSQPCAANEQNEYVIELIYDIQKWLKPYLE